jgi:hypothetical protein
MKTTYYQIIKSLYRSNLHRLLFAVLLILVVASSTLVAQAQEPGNGSIIFIPMINKGNGEPAGENPPPEPPPPTEVSGAFFVDPNLKIGSSGIAVDKDGGSHIVYAHYLPYVEDPQAVYLYCPDAPGVDCLDITQWNGVAMGVDVNEVQIAVTDAGQPRVLFRTDSTVYDTGMDYYYAACDQNCTDPTEWEVVYIVSNYGTAIFDIGDNTSPQRSFALDPQGRPRFIYQDRNYFIEPDHYGAYYVYCDANCTDHTPDNPTWFQTQISEGVEYNYEVYYYPSLTFTSQGEPRAVAYISALDEAESKVSYIACDVDCEDGSNWERVALFERGSTTEVAWDIELDSQDRPRIAYYEGDQIGDEGDIVHYAWCNTGDCLSAAQWSSVVPGFGRLNGQDVDLELDDQDRPRMAMIHSGGSGLAYGWCDTNCESAQGEWNYEVQETGVELEEEYPIPLPVTCDAGLWDSMTPMLALDPAGNPHIVYDSAYETRCWYDDPNDNQDPWLRFHQLWHAVRTVVFPQK